MTTPNFRRLQMAYDIFKDIPRKKVHLSQIVAKCDVENNHCGTIACGMGWLGLSPSFKRMGLRYNTESDILEYAHKQWADYDDAAVDIFDIDQETANYLFDPKEGRRSERPYVEYKGSTRREMISHKSELLRRIETVFQYHGKEVRK